MLQVYASKLSIKPDDKFILSSDLFFELLLTQRKLRVDQQVAAIMKSIDGATPVNSKAGPYTFISRDNVYLDFRYLSTGCKTVINVYSCPKTLFYAIECGNNAHLELLKLPRGKVIIPNAPFSLEDFSIDCQLITPDKTVHCSSFFELESNWDF